MRRTRELEVSVASAKYKKKGLADCLLTVGQVYFGIFKNDLDKIHFTGVKRLDTSYRSAQ
jgi:hypothetical protein